MRQVVGPIAIALAVLLSLPGSATLAEDELPVVTVYLHSTAPLANPHSIADGNSEVRTPVANGGVSGLGPFLDEEPPVNAAAKLAYTSGLGNADFRKNFLLVFWSGETNGRMQDASATLYLQAAAPALVTVTIFGDGGIGVAAPLARASVGVPAGPAAPYVFDFGEQAGNVDASYVLSVSSELLFAEPSGEVTGDAGVTILYDSVTQPSSLTFALGPPVEVPPLSRTPAPGWGNVTLINASAAHRETSLAIGPLDDDLLVVCSPSGVPNTDTGQSYFHLSRDGGSTWSFLDVETASSDPRQLAFEGGDCDVAFDDAGTLYSADTWLGSLSVGSSRDGGLTWAGTNLASSAPVVDRPWLVGGPEGVVHVTWQDVQAAMPSAIWYARSTDFGLTFTPAVPVAQANEGGGFTWTGNLVVDPDQTHLYSIYTRRAGPTLTEVDTGPETVWVASSADAGLTWTQHLVAAMPRGASYLYPSLARDAGGELHAVFTSATDVDRPVWYARSADGAQTWSAPIKVLSGVATYAPWVAGGAAGEAVVHWLGSPDPLANESAPADWRFYLARVQDGNVLSAGPTTTTPVFVGQQTMPEFNEVALDSQGRAHIGASAFAADGGGTGWALFHQRAA